MRNSFQIFKLLVVMLLTLLPVQAAIGSGLNVPIQVKETAGVGAQAFPTTVVVPMPKGKYIDTTPFRVTDSNGNLVDAQFSILNKWWADDNSIRNLEVTFQPTVAAYTGTAGSGVTTYYLNDSAAASAFSGTPVSCTDSTLSGPCVAGGGTANSGALTITTGPYLQFVVNKAKPNIIDQLWYDPRGSGSFTSSNQLIASSGTNGGVLVDVWGSGNTQQDASYSSFTYTVEEAGPSRVVIKAWSPTLYYAGSNPQSFTSGGASTHKHGVAFRIYAYANQQFIKIDYQLQNSAMSNGSTATEFSWPMYFKQARIDFAFQNLGTLTAEGDLGDGNIYSCSVGSGGCPNGIEMRAGIPNPTYNGRGDWVANTAYKVNDAVYVSGYGNYACTAAVQSSTPPGSDSSHWTTLNNGAAAYSAHRYQGIVDASTASPLFPSSYPKIWKDTGSGSLNSTRTSTLLNIKGSTFGVTAVPINWWQAFPNGLRVNSSNVLSFELWPSWACHWTDDDATYQYGGTCVGDYASHSLNDMQQAYKTVYLYFHPAGTTDASLQATAKAFQSPPVATIHTGQYQAAGASFDMGGFIPIGSAVQKVDDRTYAYGTDNSGDPGPSDLQDYNTSETYYNFEWSNWFMAADKARKEAPNTTGGGPISGSWAAATENPSAVSFADYFAQGELNVMNQWMSGWTYANNWSTIPLTEEPYPPASWRPQGGNNKTVANVWSSWTTPGGMTQIYAQARDDEHAWLYHVEDAYYLTGNPWIKDWYTFAGEFRKATLTKPSNGDPITRARGHMLANALQAYRVTGDVCLLDNTRSGCNTNIAGIKQYIENSLTGEFNMTWGYHYGGSMASCDEPFMEGFLLRALISYAEEIKNSDWQGYLDAFRLIAAASDYNYNITQYNQMYDPTGKATCGTTSLASSGQSWTMCDPAAWYYVHTGNTAILTQLATYLTSGLNGGATSFQTGGNDQIWTGNWAGRWSSWACGQTSPCAAHSKASNTPPGAISTLSASNSGTSITLTWTAPSAGSGVPAPYRYIVAYGTLPFSNTYNTQGNTTSSPWWGGYVLGPSFYASPGQQQSYTFTSKITSGAVYATVLCTDTPDSMGGFNLSGISNVASVNLSGGGSYTVTASAGSNGSISPSGSVTVGSGANQSFSITPNSGYQTATLTIDGSAVTAANSYTFSNVTANHAIAATFSQTATTTYTITASAGSNGAISPSGAVTVNSGSNQSFTITPNSGCQVATLTVDGSAVTAANSYTFSNVTANHTIAATFSQTGTTAYTITASAGSNGAISPSGAVTVNSGSNQSFTITPNSGWQVATLTVDGSSVAAANSYTFSNVTASHAISATFSQTGTTAYTITASAGTNGGISPTGPVPVTGGNTQVFTVTPNNGYSVSMGGTCGGTLSGNSYTTNPITGACTVTATFSPTTRPQIPTNLHLVTSHTVSSPPWAGFSYSDASDDWITNGPTGQTSHKMTKVAFTLDGNTAYMTPHMGESDTRIYMATRANSNSPWYMHPLTSGRGIGFRDGPAAFAQFHWTYSGYPDTDIGIDRNTGNLYIADSANLRIRRLYQSNGQWFVTTVLGNCVTYDFSGNASNSGCTYTSIPPAGSPQNAQNVAPGTLGSAVAVDSNGNIFFSYGSNGNIGKMTPNGSGGYNVSNLWSFNNNANGYCGGSSNYVINNIMSCDIDASNYLYCASRTGPVANSSFVFKINTSNGQMTPLNCGVPTQGNDVDGAISAASTYNVTAVAVSLTNTTNSSEPMVCAGGGDELLLRCYNTPGDIGRWSTLQTNGTFQEVSNGVGWKVGAARGYNPAAGQFVLGHSQSETRNLRFLNGP